MSEHTKEPWEITPSNNNNSYKIIKFNHSEIAVDCSKEDAHRIVTCVNALAGIDDVEGLMEEIEQALYSGCDCAYHSNNGLKMPCECCKTASKLFPTKEAVEPTGKVGG